jgi:hypothetical protein
VEYWRPDGSVLPVATSVPTGGLDYFPEGDALGAQLTPGALAELSVPVDVVATVSVPTEGWHAAPGIVRNPRFGVPAASAFTDTWSLDFPAPEDGDLLLVSLLPRNASGGAIPVCSTPAGWTLQAQATLVGSSFEGLRLYTRFWYVGDPLTVSGTLSVIGGWGAFVVAYRGVDPVTTMDVAPVVNARPVGSAAALDVVLTSVTNGARLVLAARRP